VTRRRALAAACLALAAACSGSPDASDLDPVSTPSSPSTSLVRLPSGGGIARAYSLPDLAETDWRPEGRLPELDSVIGVNGEQAIVFARDARGGVASIDLPGARVRPGLRGVRSASVAADGTLYTVDTAGAVVAYGRRAPERFAARFEGPPPRLYGALGGRIIAIAAGGGELSVVAARDSGLILPIADGPVAVTLWGDLVAVAADTAVVVYDPAAQRPPRAIEMDEGARAVAFSPSGHQLYVAQDDARLAVVERFSLEVRELIDLPGRADQLRPGPFGRWLLAHAIGSDSVWVVDLESARLAGAVEAEWDGDLPLVAGAGTLVIRSGGDVRAHDLAAPGFPERGRVADGAEDLWVAPTWAPPRTAAESPTDTAVTDRPDEAATDSGAPPEERIFLQISSSQNPDWARELSDKLTSAGLPARVLPPGTAGDPYRVVLGPYASREEAEETGRSLGMPYFVINAAEPVAP
jgi:hypothetical protein